MPFWVSQSADVRCLSSSTLAAIAGQQLRDGIREGFGFQVKGLGAQLLQVTSARFEVIVVVNKVDCLLDKMRDKEKVGSWILLARAKTRLKTTCRASLENQGLARLKVWVRRMSRQIRNVHTNDVVCSLVSGCRWA